MDFIAPNGSEFARPVFEDTKSQPLIATNSGTLALRRRRAYGIDSPPIPYASRLQHRTQYQLQPPVETQQPFAQSQADTSFESNIFENGIADAATNEELDQDENGIDELRLPKLRSNKTYGPMELRTTGKTLPRTPSASTTEKPLPPTPSTSKEEDYENWRYHNRQEYHARPRWPGQRDDPNLHEFASHSELQPLLEPLRSSPLVPDASLENPQEFTRRSNVSGIQLRPRTATDPTWASLAHVPLSRTGAREKDVEERLAARNYRVNFADQSPPEIDPFNSLSRSKKGPLHPAVRRVLSMHNQQQTPTKQVPRSFSLAELRRKNTSGSLENAKMAGFSGQGQPAVESQIMKGLPKHSSMVQLRREEISEILSVENGVNPTVPKSSSLNILRHKPTLDNLRERGMSLFSKSKPKPIPQVIIEDRTYDVTYSPLVAGRSRENTYETSNGSEPRTPSMISQETLNHNLWDAQDAIRAHFAGTLSSSSIANMAPLNMPRQASRVFRKGNEPYQSHASSRNASSRSSGGYEELVIGYLADRIEAEAGNDRDSDVQLSSVNTRKSIRSLSEGFQFGGEEHMASMVKSIFGSFQVARGASASHRAREVEEEKLSIEQPIVQNHQDPSPVIARNEDDDRYSMAQNIRQASSSNIPRQTAQTFSTRGSSKGWDSGFNLPQNHVPELDNLYDFEDFADAEDYISDEEDSVVEDSSSVDRVGFEGMDFEGGNGLYDGVNRTMPSTLSSIDQLDYQAFHVPEDQNESLEPLMRPADPEIENLRGDGNVPTVSHRKNVAFEDAVVAEDSPNTPLGRNGEPTLERTPSFQRLLERRSYQQMSDRYIMKLQDEKDLADGVEKKECNGLRSRFRLKKLLSKANLR